ncbi:MAG TPA: ATP-binding cassette domain-containing protein [Candidatus Limnocylindrales bacterium]|nr:ATP-binding cassette domain-containing protein [Candidatus Limnocylindrales bacterium]
MSSGAAARPGGAAVEGPPAPLAIRLRALRKRFGNLVALDRIDLDVAGAQMVGVVGPDGAGKTTLLRCLTGLLEVEAEEATVLGHDLRADVRDLKRVVGYVPQSFSLQRNLSIADNLAFTARLQRIPRDVFRRREQELLERTGLAPFRDRAAGDLSGGMKQKLAIANALLPEPQLLVLDEPTAGVDVVARGEIYEILEERRREVLIVVSTSYLDEAEGCDRLVYLHSGRVVADGSPGQLEAVAGIDAYRAWTDDAAAAVRGALSLPYTVRARVCGRFVRVEVPRVRSLTVRAVCSDLQEIAGVALAEAAPRDLESTLLALSHGAEGRGTQPRTETVSTAAAALVPVSAEPIIHARGLTRRFGSFTAVDRADISVPAGAIFAFLGANGSGKTTTIRMLIGLLAPSEGSAVVAGVDVIEHPRRVRDAIGYMGQRVSLYKGLTLRENVEFYAGLHGIAGKELERRWGGMRERFDLAEAETRQSDDLPAGLRQRAGLALATLHDPRMLFLDEPTAGVDVESRAMFWELIREHKEEGVTVFVTTHFLEEADYCDLISFIDRGRIVVDAEPEELRARFSPGYTATCELPPERRAAAAAELVRAGWTVHENPAGLHLSSARATSAMLRSVCDAAGSEACGRVRVDQPPMATIFRRIILDGNGAHSGGRSVGAVSTTDAAGRGTPAHEGGR